MDAENQKTMVYEYDAAYILKILIYNSRVLCFQDGGDYEWTIRCRKQQQLYFKPVLWN